MAKRKKARAWTTKQSVWVGYPTKEHRIIEIEVDWDSLAYQLGVKAFNNKSGKTRFAAGAIKAVLK